ncbi:hypothetical protein FRC03_000475 [Tulasnella sp. 419]|nr:hypothetical protein FRC03_000475 [Tulasnella sp. 419]
MSILRRAIQTSARRHASLLPGTATAPYQVFDRHVKQLQKDRAAAAENGERSRIVDYVRNEIAERMMERFEDIKRELPNILDIGSGAGHLTQLLENQGYERSVTMVELSEQMLHRDPDDQFEVNIKRICADEERLLEVIQPNSQDAAISCLSLHWVNDLPGALTQIKEALKPDGVFVGAMFGGETLFELRTALQLAEVEREGGISPRISPMTDTRDVSNLLGRAGFTLLTVDIDEVKVNYPSMWELMEDLRDMGESNAVIGRLAGNHLLINPNH